MPKYHITPEDLEIGTEFICLREQPAEQNSTTLHDIRGIQLEAFKLGKVYTLTNIKGDNSHSRRYTIRIGFNPRINMARILRLTELEMEKVQSKNGLVGLNGLVLLPKQNISEEYLFQTMLEGGMPDAQ